MFSRTKVLFHNMRPTVNCQMKCIYIHTGKKFIISKKLFENDQSRCNKNITGPDGTWTSKLSVCHKLLDVNNDGIVSIEDLRELTKRFSKVNKMSEDETLKFSKVIENLWYKHWGCIDPFDYITVERYVKYIQYAQKNKDLKKDVIQLLPYLFKVVDKDQSGYITREEYNTFLECIGTSNKRELIKSLGIINDTDNTIKLDDLMEITENYLFHNANETNNY